MDSVLMRSRRARSGGRRAGSYFALRAAMLLACLGWTGCGQLAERVSVQPRALPDVPAERLAFRFEPDLNPEVLPSALKGEESEEPLAPVRADFETRRREERLVRTAVSPDGQRALALYETSDTPEGDFRIDLYSADGTFIRNVLPQDLSATFAPAVAWSPDGQHIAFIGVKTFAPQPTPTPLDDLLPTGPPPIPDPAEAPAEPTPTIAPLIPPVPVFNTEQIYVGDRDGANLRPLTTRDGLIYFQLAWSPDSSALAALAAKENEWDARRAENRAPAGRPRLIMLDGRERLLDDRLTEAVPVWSPDASKIATAFETDVAIYDAIGERPTAAGIALREPLLLASARYDTEKLAKQSEPPLSFNPVVRLAWPQPETLLVQTAFVRMYKSGETITNYPRWHVVHLSPQAALLS